LWLKFRKSVTTVLPPVNCTIPLLITPTPINPGDRASAQGIILQRRHASPEAKDLAGNRWRINCANRPAVASRPRKPHEESTKGQATSKPSAPKSAG